MTEKVFREKFRITQWRNGAVYRAESLGLMWVDEAEVNANRAPETNVIWMPPSPGYTVVGTRRTQTGEGGAPCA